MITPSQEFLWLDGPGQGERLSSLLPLLFGGQPLDVAHDSVAGVERGPVVPSAVVVGLHHELKGPPVGGPWGWLVKCSLIPGPQVGRFDVQVGETGADLDQCAVGIALLLFQEVASEKGIDLQRLKVRPHLRCSSQERGETVPKAPDGQVS